MFLLGRSVLWLDNRKGTQSVPVPHISKVVWQKVEEEDQERTGANPDSLHEQSLNVGSYGELMDRTGVDTLTPELNWKLTMTSLTLFKGEDRHILVLWFVYKKNVTWPLCYMDVLQEQEQYEDYTADGDW